MGKEEESGVEMRESVELIEPHSSDRARPGCSWGR